MKNIPYLHLEAIKSFINQALAEDVGSGDHSTLGSVPASRQGKAQLIIKQSGVIAGLELASIIFEHYDPSISVDLLMKDGDRVEPGDIGLLVSGSVRSVLTTERLVLNCLQRMSGIATQTSILSEMISGTKARLMDTRKTTPNFRMMEKWAVLIGGGLNHRFGLYDMVMLKDNHVDFAGGIPEAISATRAYLNANKLDLKIEIETRSLDEVRKVLDVGGVDIIMLDNMDEVTMRKAVSLVDGRFLLEASGGITESNLLGVAQCGVDFISVGALTHHVKSLDMSLKAI